MRRSGVADARVQDDSIWLYPALGASRLKVRNHPTDPTRTNIANGRYGAEAAARALLRNAGSDCRRIDGRYDQETIAIRRDLDAKIAAADRATIAEARTGSAVTP
jgi:hypothetical protein